MLLYLRWKRGLAPSLANHSEIGIAVEHSVFSNHSRYCGQALVIIPEKNECRTVKNSVLGKYKLPHKNPNLQSLLITQKSPIDLK